VSESEPWEQHVTQAAELMAAHAPNTLRHAEKLKCMAAYDAYLGKQAALDVVCDADFAPSRFGHGVWLEGTVVAAGGMRLLVEASERAWALVSRVADALGWTGALARSGSAN
jgi:hypothetical protein